MGLWKEQIKRFCRNRGYLMKGEVNSKMFPMHATGRVWGFFLQSEYFFKKIINYSWVNWNVQPCGSANAMEQHALYTILCAVRFYPVLNNYTNSSRKIFEF